MAKFLSKQHEPEICRGLRFEMSGWLEDLFLVRVCG